MDLTKIDADNGYYAHQVDGRKPLLSGDYRCKYSDFIVEEQLGFELSGQGEHLCLWVEKQGQNTAYVAKQLAKYANVRVRDVSYCGLKDRHGITRQWFCLPVPIKAEFNHQGFSCAGVTILKAVRHTKKLRTGVHKANGFSIVIRNITGADDSKALLEDVIRKIERQGVPNYYGPQRFGHDAGNLYLAQKMFAGESIRDRKLKSLVLSAARSYLFNQLLSARLVTFGLNKPIDGDIYKLAGSNSFFSANVDEQIQTRLSTNDIQLALPLPGSEKLLCESKALAFQLETLQAFDIYLKGLTPFKLAADCRAMVLMPQDMSYQWLDEDLQLQFTLPKGSFATSVLRELLKLNDCSLKS